MKYQKSTYFNLFSLSLDLDREVDDDDDDDDDLDEVLLLEELSELPEEPDELLEELQIKTLG